MSVGLSFHSSRSAEAQKLQPVQAAFPEEVEDETVGVVVEGSEELSVLESVEDNVEDTVVLNVEDKLVDMVVGAAPPTAAAEVVLGDSATAAVVAVVVKEEVAAATASKEDGEEVEDEADAETATEEEESVVLLWALARMAVVSSRAKLRGDVIFVRSFVDSPYLSTQHLLYHSVKHIGPRIVL